MYDQLNRYNPNYISIMVGYMQSGSLIMNPLGTKESIHIKQTS